MNRKKILHIQKVKGISGSEKNLLSLLPCLDPQKYEAHFLILEESSLPQEEYESLFKGTSVKVHRWLIHRHLDFRVFLKLIRFIRREKFDLVHTHLIHADIHGVLAARLAGVPIIMSTKHGWDIYPRIKKRELWLLRFVSRYLDHVVTISDALDPICKKYERIPEGKMTTIYYSLPPAESFSPVSSDHFLFLGRLMVEKGCRELLKAFRQVLEEFPNAKLKLAGDGPLRREMEGWVEQNGLGEAIKILGYQKDIDSLIDQSAVVVLPSYGEGFGLVLLEAMAHQRPVIATNVSAIPEVVQHGKTGLLVPPKNVHSLVEAMKTFLRDPDLEKKLGQAGYERLKKHFSPEQMVSKTEALYDRLLS